MSDSESAFDDDDIICDDDDIICDDDDIICDDDDIICEDDDIICEETVVLQETEPQDLPNQFSDINFNSFKYIQKKLDEIVQLYAEREVLPDVIAELIINKELNLMVLDLFDYVKGYEISFRKYAQDEEIFHGRYSYAVSLIEYIKDGEIPYEVFDNLFKYDFKIFYDGYVACQLRIHYGQEDDRQSHFVLLKHSMQTIDAECSMNCKLNSSLYFEEERARLIKYCSPDLCLDPDPVVAEIVISNELNQHPFITPYLKDIILNEKVRREKGIVEMMKKPKNQESASRKLKKDDWRFRLNPPTKEEVELSKLGTNLGYQNNIETYLRDRPICFPDEKSFTGFPVEIESFVYEYNKKDDTIITDKLSVSVLDEREYYYGAYRLDESTKERERKSSNWVKIGSREELDFCVNAFTLQENELFHDEMKITHYRMFDEKYKYSDGRTTIIRQKLAVPVSQVVTHYNEFPTEDESEEEEGVAMDEN